MPAPPPPPSLTISGVLASTIGAIQVLRNAIFLEIGPPPTPS